MDTVWLLPVGTYSEEVIRVGSSVFMFQMKEKVLQATRIVRRKNRKDIVVVLFLT